jgi:hypothetical protein
MSANGMAWRSAIASLIGHSVRLSSMFALLVRHRSLSPVAGGVRFSHHMPAMAYADRLAGKRVGFKRGEE